YRNVPRLDTDNFHSIAVESAYRFRQLLADDHGVISKVFETSVHHVGRKRGQRTLHLRDNALDDDAVRLCSAVDQTFLIDGRGGKHDTRNLLNLFRDPQVIGDAYSPILAQHRNVRLGSKQSLLQVIPKSGIDGERDDQSSD